MDRRPEAVKTAVLSKDQILVFCAQLVAYLFGEETGLFPRRVRSTTSCNMSSVGTGTVSAETVGQSSGLLDGMPTVRFELTGILSCISQDSSRDALGTGLRRFASLCACESAIWGPIISIDQYHLWAQLLPARLVPFKRAVSALGDGRSTSMDDKCPEDIESSDIDRVSMLGLGVMSLM